MTIDELSGRLKDEFQEIYNCVLINGAWGIGKSYYLEKEFLKDKDFVKISLFGLNSIEEVKTAIYSQLNKKLNIIKNGFYRFFSGSSVTLFGGVVSLPIPYFENDINKAIEKKIKKTEQDKINDWKNEKKSKYIMIIDDLERKSSNIKMEDILGIIESFSLIKNLSIIVVANEEKIEDKEDRKIYNDFKEKVIKKTYNVDKYSQNALKQILENSCKNIKLKVERKELLKNNIIEIFEQQNIKNLRTLEKVCYFIKLILKNLNVEEITDKEFSDLILISSYVVIEDIEKKYEEEENRKRKEREEKGKTTIREALEESNSNTFVYCIIKNYLKEIVFSNIKIDLVNFIYQIYKDINIKSNFNRIAKYYKDLHILNDKDNSKVEKDLFYLSEEELNLKINAFYNKFVLEVNKSIDANNWFKKFSENYYYAEKIGIETIFEDDKIQKAMDGYVENLNSEENLFNLIKRQMLHNEDNEKIKYYRKILNKKIANWFYNKKIDNLKENFSSENIEIIFSIYTEDQYDIDKSKIIERIKEENYFIPNLNGELTDNIWGIAHTIWEQARRYREYRDKTFEECVENILSTATVLGKYRINSLNEQYQIDLSILENKK